MMVQATASLFSQPVRVHYGDVWTLGKHRLMCGDSTNPNEVARLLQGEQIDLVFADPPYGIGIDAWDKKIEDVSAFIDHVTSCLKQGAFFAFTHQMPYMVEWLHILEYSHLRYKDHVMWAKRKSGAVAQELLRTHESLFIYSNGKAKYYQAKGRYEDVKLPGVLVDVNTLEGIDRHIKDLQIKARGGTPTERSGNGRHSSYRYMKAFPDRSPEFANFTNVWSFLPDNQRQRNATINHATAKPTLLMSRLIELTTPLNAAVYDAFLGSGTTLISATSTGRTCYGMELSPEYCELAIQRWQDATGQQGVLLCQ